jgi:hypothetical protein
MDYQTDDISNLIVDKDSVLANDGLLFTVLNQTEPMLTEYKYNDLRNWSIELSELESYIINTEEELLKILDIAIEKEDVYYIYPVIEIYDPKAMLEFGFWPTSFEIKDLEFTSWLNDIDINTILFWSNNESKYRNLFNRFKKELRWKYVPLDIWKRNAIKYANSIPLKLYSPDLMYNTSKRPINDMEMFRNPTSNRVNINDIKNNKINIDNELWNVIPVTRYAAGMKKGLYYKNNLMEEFCGTFYYYEPESTTYLAYKTFLRAFNKTAAMNILFLNDSYINKIKGRIVQNFYIKSYPYIMKHVNGIYPKNLLLTPNEAVSLYIDENKDANQIINEANLLPQNKYYAGHYLDLYAAEDALDQILCTTASELGYDIIILENMVGSHQVVTEILDTRKRAESFKSLIYITT